MAEKKRPMGPGRRGNNAPPEKAKDFKGTLKKLVAYLKQYHLAIAIVILFTIGSTVFNILGPKILGKATTEIFNGLISKIQGGAGIDFSKIGRILIMLIILYLISAAFSYIQGFIMAGVSQKVSYNLRKELSEKINRLPMNYYDKTTYGEVLSRITNDVDTLGTGLNQTLHQLINSVATMVGVFCMMLSISPLMTLIAVVTLPISAILVAVVIKHSQKYFVAQQEYLGHVNGQIEEVFGGHNVIKLFNKEESVLKEFEEKNDILYQSAWKSQFLSGLMQPLMNFVGNLGYAAVVVAGGYLSIKGTIEVGDIQSFIQYVKQFTQPVSQIAQVSNMLQSTMAASERVFAFLDEGEEEQQSFLHETLVDPETGKERNVTIDDLDGSVEFWHVNFGYTREKQIIHDLNLKVKPGQKIAIVGPTGAGKTTIVKLLMRFYDIDDGAIRLNDYDVQGFDRTELREAFGMVLQDTWLFKGTIMENIRYGRLDATDEEVIAAARAAHVHHFIQTLEHGYDTELNEEATNISQGQKQLLTIARAILADNKVLILDEATSSVDTRTEELIQEAMDTLMEGRTSFVIAHRLSTIKNSDVILVLKDGDVIEQGNHEELMEAKGFYYNLYNSQFEETA